MSDRTIHKFPFIEPGIITVVGGNPQVVLVDVDLDGFHDMPCVWVEYDPAGHEVLGLTFIGTGHSVPTAGDAVFDWTHAGSVVCRSAGLVWHVYERYVEFP